VTVNADLFTIASAGIRAQTQLLNTTGTNIANVNTEGFVRQRTEFGTEIDGVVDRGTTTRIFDQFAFDQLRRDTSFLAESEAVSESASIIDNVLASEANSISGSLSRFFESLQTAADEPTNIAARQLVLGQSEALLGQISTIEGFLSDREGDTNDQITNVVSQANALIQSISELNQEIRSTAGISGTESPGALLNARDQAILDLSELVAIETRIEGDGTTLVSLNTGQSLVLQTGTFNLFELSGDPDIDNPSLTLQSNDADFAVPILDGSAGGEIGGLLEFRDEVLFEAQRDVGQIALSLAGAVNATNRLGLDFDGQIGGDIFELPEIQGLNFQDNSSLALGINARFEDGGFSDLTSLDYQVTITGTSAGPPANVDIEVATLNPDGSPATDINGAAIVNTFNGLEAAAGTFVPVIDGLEFEFTGGSTYAAGDRFLFQPTKDTASQIQLAISRPEDIALGSPIRVQRDNNNFGDASIIGTTVTNTTIDNTLAESGASAFNGAGGIQSLAELTAAGVVTTVGAPASVLFTAEDAYDVLDSDGNVIASVAGATDLNNILGQATFPAPFAALDDYPGFDFSLSGNPRAGDIFTIEFNTNGVDDNRNGLDLADLQNQDLLRLNNNVSGAQNLISFNEAYSVIVGDVGERTFTADIQLQAATALEAQSQDRFDSISSVSLDEEAANLIRFQQAYAASARILTTAQTIFDTLLGATG
jgi:flagellar hook-associated protein 1 FlgK